MSGGNDDPIAASEVLPSPGGIGRVEKVLRKTSTTETKALFWQIQHNSGDTDISLKIGRYEKDSWIPFRRATNEITLNEEELEAVIDFVSQNYRPVKMGETKWLPVTDAAIQKYLDANPGILTKLANEKLTSQDVVALGYRKKQLDIFEFLLVSDANVAKYKDHFKIEGGDEKVWQYYFEKNPWIFGYGLNYVFNRPLEGKKLEQVISGFDVAHHGKKVDALLKTSGLVNSICLVEIKKSSTSLLGDEYRTGVWEPSKDLQGGTQQLREYVRQTIKNLGTITINDSEGNPTDEKLYTYSPRATLVVGSLSEFQTELGVNQIKFFSFESFRRGQLGLEIITFDELYNRAKYIVEHVSSST